jgi:hypothetical protein
MSIDLHKLLYFAAENNASDLHPQADAVPLPRVGSQMRTVDAPSLMRWARCRLDMLFEFCETRRQARTRRGVAVT